jgi:hypothetical protein
MGKLNIVPRKQFLPEKLKTGGTMVHSMNVGDSIQIGDNIEINLTESRANRSTIQIKAPLSIPIRRKNRAPQSV